jgi:hypothetical protein
MESPGLRLLGEGLGYFEILSKLATKEKIKGPRIDDARIVSFCLHHGVKKLWRLIAISLLFRIFPVKIRWYEL